MSVFVWANLLASTGFVDESFLTAFTSKLFCHCHHRPLTTTPTSITFLIVLLFLLVLEMVYYFVSKVTDSPATIYVGKDKFESTHPYRGNLEPRADLLCGVL